MRSVEPFDFAPLGNAQSRVVQETNFGKFGGDAFVDANCVVMPTFDHKWSRGDERRHLGIVERGPQIELENLLLVGPDVRVILSRRHVLIDPVIEVSRADRKTIVGNKRRNTHGTLAAIGQSIKSDALRVDIGLGL